MVLVNPGRVGRRQTFIKAPPYGGAFFISVILTMRAPFFITLFIGLYSALAVNAQDVAGESDSVTGAFQVTEYTSSFPDSVSKPKSNFLEKNFDLEYSVRFESNLPAVHYRNTLSRTLVQNDLSIGTLGAPMVPLGLPKGTWFEDFNALKQEPYPMYFRKGPIPSVEWTYRSSQGRGQYFELNATAPQSAYKHWNVHYGRLQAQGQLYNEQYGADQLIVMHEARDSADTWEFKGSVRAIQGTRNEAGGVADPGVLTESTAFIANRALVPTRWTTAKSNASEISGWATLMLHKKWLISYAGKQNVRSYQGPTLGFSDTLSSRTQEMSLGRKYANWASSSVRVGLLQRGQYVSDSNSSFGVTWDPYVQFADRSLEVKYHVASGNYKVVLDRLLRTPVKLTAERNYAPYWSGQEVLQPSTFSALMRLANGRLRLLYEGFSERNLLLAQNAEDLGVWTATPASRLVKVQWVSPFSMDKSWKDSHLDFTANFTWTSAPELMTPPIMLKAAWDRQWNINPNTQFFIALEATGWAGPWARPVYVAERGQFAYSPNSGTIAPNGIVTPLAGIRFKKEAELLLKFQNANQGWIPNTIFLAENYPLAAAAVLFEGRWRMFN